MLFENKALTLRSNALFRRHNIPYYSVYGGGSLGQYVCIHQDAADGWFVTYAYLYLALREQITPWFIIGTILILTGMYMCNHATHKEKSAG